jgi:hypothetical protein
MNTEELAGILKRGGTVKIDCGTWAVDSAHGTIDMPRELAEPAPNEDDDDLLNRQSLWWDSLRVCSSDDTEHVTLIEALCLLAGVRVQRP